MVREVRQAHVLHIGPKIDGMKLNFEIQTLTMVSGLEISMILWRRISLLRTIEADFLSWKAISCLWARKVLK